MEIIKYEEVESTNKLAKEMVREGKVAPFCLVAGRQTSGVGNYGKKFWSPRGGLYMSLVLPEKDFRYRFGTGFVAVRLMELIKGARIKWVNDILVDGKKVAGILVEKVAGHFVIGIGINLFQTEDVPEELVGVVGFLGYDIDVRDVVNVITKTKLSDENVRELYTKYSGTPISLDGSKV